MKSLVLVVSVSMLVFASGCSSPQKDHAKRMDAMTLAHERKMTAMEFAAKEAEEARRLGVPNVIPTTPETRVVVVPQPGYYTSRYFWTYPTYYRTHRRVVVRHHHHHVQRPKGHGGQHHGGGGKKK